jgi:glycosyltransferase involved in cell wall biosynthesis
MTKEISIVIATYNRCQGLSDVLDDLLKLRTDGISYEVIVVDNNSNDQTKQVVAKAQTKLQDKIVYLFEPRQGKSHAMNLAIANARGNILAFTDDDIKIDPDWLVNLRECFSRYSCDGAGGRVLPSYDIHTPPSKQDLNPRYRWKEHKYRCFLNNQ